MSITDSKCRIIIVAVPIDKEGEIEIEIAEPIREINEEFGENKCY